MKFCIPVCGPEGLEALLQPEFTAAEHLLIFDLQSGEHRTFSREGDEGEAQPEEPIAIDAILCAGMHPGIVRAFAAQGIQVFATEAESAAAALQSLKDGEVEELLAGGGCCGGHDHGDDQGCCGGHGHDDDHECCGGKGHGEAGSCGCGGHDEEEHECCGGGGGCGCHA